MFKVGDKIIVIDNTYLSNSFNVGDKFVVLGIYGTIVNINPNNRYSHYDMKHFKLQISQERKEKLKIICSKSEIM